MTSVTFVTVGSVPKKLESNTFVNVGSGSIWSKYLLAG